MYPNISANGTKPRINLDPLISSVPSIRPRRELISPITSREFKVEANVGAPQVAYKEGITKEANIDMKYAKQSGGRGQYGHCKVIPRRELISPITSPI